MRRGALLLGLIGAVLIAVLWWFFLVTPQNDEISSLDDQTAALQLEESSLQAQKAQLLEIRDNELTYMTAGASLERLIPSDPELATFIDDVNILARETGISINALTPALPAGEAEDVFQSISVFMDLEGQFFEVLGFLYGLSDMERLVRVDSVTLNVGAEENGITTLTASLDTLIFTTAQISAPVEGVPADGAPADGGEPGVDGGDPGLEGTP